MTSENGKPSRLIKSINRLAKSQREKIDEDIQAMLERDAEEMVNGLVTRVVSQVLTECRRNPDSFEIPVPEDLVHKASDFMMRITNQLAPHGIRHRGAWRHAYLKNSNPEQNPISGWHVWVDSGPTVPHADVATDSEINTS